MHVLEADVETCKYILFLRIGYTHTIWQCVDDQSHRPIRCITVIIVGANDWGSRTQNWRRLIVTSSGNQTRSNLYNWLCIQCKDICLVEYVAGLSPQRKLAIGSPQIGTRRCRNGCDCCTNLFFGWGRHGIRVTGWWLAAKQLQYKTKWCSQVDRHLQLSYQAYMCGMMCERVCKLWYTSQYGPASHV